MLTRRSFWTLISSLPLLSACVSEPVPAAELRERGAFSAGRRVYAYKGESVTCQNGHAICEFAETVYWGDSLALVCWRQLVPKIGSRPVCAQCGEVCAVRLDALHRIVIPFD